MTASVASERTSLFLYAVKYGLIIALFAYTNETEDMKRFLHTNTNIILVRFSRMVQFLSTVIMTQTHKNNFFSLTHSPLPPLLTFLN